MMRTAIYRRAVDSRRALNCAVAALLIALLANGANAQDSDLIAYYTFDNGVVDVTGNVEPIDTQQNAPRAPGKYGQALQFDGTHFVEVPILLSARYQPEFTVSMWVKMAPPPIDEDALRAMSNTATVVSDVLSIHATRSAEPYFFARVPGATASNREHRTYPGQWAHVMVTRKLEDRANRDGEMEPHIVTTIYSGGIATERARQFRDQSHQPSMYLGARDPQHKFPFIGLIDDLKIYSTAMSEAQVASLSRPAAGAVAASPSPGITNPTDAANNGVDDAFGGGSNTDGSALPAPGSGATGPGSIGGPVVARPPGGINPNVPTQDDIPNDPVGGLLGGGSGSTSLPDVTTAAEERTNVDPTVPGDVDLDDQRNELEDLAREQSESGAFAEVDWQIVSVTPSTPANEPVPPGSTLSYDIRLRKYDPGNNQPDVRLVFNPGGNADTRNVIKDVSLNTSMDNRHAEVTTELDITVPFDGAMYPGERHEWTPTVYLLSGDGTPLRDTDADNHRRSLSINIVEPEDEMMACENATDSGDGDMRTSRNCLQSENETTEFYFDDTVLVYTDLPRSNVATEYRLLLQQKMLSILWNEKGDKPCELTLNNNDARIDVCGGEVWRGLDHWPSILNIKSNEAIVGLQVCRNAGDNRFKGLKVRVKTLNADGTLSNSFRTETFEKTNCSQRTEWDFCPGGTVARGLRVWVKDGTLLAPRRFINSLDLICNTPLVREPSS